MGRLPAQAFFGLTILVALPACVARYQLRDADLIEAKAQQSLSALRVYPSNRTISVYDEDASRTVVVSREIRDRSTKARRKRLLRLQTSGAIIGEGLLNGAALLWVTFDQRCVQPDCAYGFVRTEDGRYRLVHVPEREGFRAPRVYRGWVAKRRQMSRGNLYALAEANAVYRLVRKRPKTVFLEVKKEIRDRTRGGREREPGV